MTPDEKRDWNYDRIVAAQAAMGAAQTYMARTLHTGKVHKGVVDRMVRHLQSAADDLARLHVYQTGDRFAILADTINRVYPPKAPRPDAYPRKGYQP